MISEFFTSVGIKAIIVVIISIIIILVKTVTLSRISPSRFYAFVPEEHILQIFLASLMSVIDTSYIFLHSIILERDLIPRQVFEHSLSYQMFSMLIFLPYIFVKKKKKLYRGKLIFWTSLLEDSDASV